jgi:hypothetical protein
LGFTLVDLATQRRHEDAAVAGPSENALTWFFAGLVIIGAVAGLLGQVVTG